MESFITIQEGVIMGVLTQINNSESKAKILADNLISEAVGLYNHLNGTYTDSTFKFWKNPELSPQQIADALGTNGKELFLLHYQIGQLLENIAPGSLSEVNSQIGNFTLNEDGTITVL